MAKCIFFSIPAHGHINPTLKVAEELKKQGETVIYYSSNKFINKIKKTGADTREIKTSFDDIIDEEKEKISKNVYKLARALIEGGKEIVENLFEEIKKENPDYIIYDFLSIPGRIFSKALNIPSIVFIPTFVFDERKLNLSVPWWYNFQLFKQGITAYYDILKYLKIAFYLSKEYKIDIQNLIYMYNNYGELNIVPLSRYFQPNSYKYNSERFIFSGPLFFEKREEPDFPLEILKNKKIIYFSLGTVYNYNTKIYELIFKTFNNTEFLVLVSIPEKSEIKKIFKNSTNFIIRDYIPQLQVLPFVDCFITHGGMNSVVESLYFKVPLIFIPHAMDQFLIAERVSRLGAGIFLKKIKKDKLLKAVDDIINNENYKINAEKISDSFKNSGGINLVIKKINEFKNKYNIQ